MRSNNEVTVNRRAFLQAVTRIPRGGLRMRGQYTPRYTVIFATPPMLYVDTPWVCTELEAEGEWWYPIGVYPRVLIKAARAMPRKDKITLLWIEGRLHLEPLSIDAWIVADCPHGGTVRKTPALKAPKATPATAPIDEGGQFLMPGLALVTDRERLALMARAPVRPRRR